MSRRVLEEEAVVTSIPERRGEVREPVAVETGGIPDEKGGKGGAPAGFTVWRCKVCGYLCARVSPPEVCPICKVPRDRFEPFEFG